MSGQRCDEAPEVRQRVAHSVSCGLNAGTRISPGRGRQRVWLRVSGLGFRLGTESNPFTTGQHAVLPSCRAGSANGESRFRLSCGIPLRGACPFPWKWHRPSGRQSLPTVGPILPVAPATPRLRVIFEGRHPPPNREASRSNRCRARHQAGKGAVSWSGRIVISRDLTPTQSAAPHSVSPARP